MYARTMDFRVETIQTNCLVTVETERSYINLNVGGVLAKRSPRSVGSVTEVQCRSRCNISRAS